MDITIVVGCWVFPTLITVISIGYCLFVYDDGTRGMMSGLGNIFMLIPTLGISLISWIIYAIFK